jgi:hypothetical protein
LEWTGYATGVLLSEPLAVARMGDGCEEGRGEGSAEEGYDPMPEEEAM